MLNMFLIIGAVVIGAAFFLGVLVGGEAQRHLLRGHEGTRADKLRMLRAQRAAALHRRRQQLYGPMLQVVEPDPSPEPERPSDWGPPFGSRPPAQDHDRWWRRHPGPTRPDLKLPDDPEYDEPPDRSSS